MLGHWTLIVRALNQEHTYTPIAFSLFCVAGRVERSRRTAARLFSEENGELNVEGLSFAVGSTSQPEGGELITELHQDQERCNVSGESHK